MPGRHTAPPSPVRRALTELGRVLLPVACAGCGRPDEPVCAGCRRALAGPAGVVRGVAGVPVTAVVPYAGVPRRLLLAWKDDGRHDLAPLVAAALARSLVAALAVDPGPRGRDPPAVLVVPVPSSAGASRRRGGDVLAEVAGRAAGRTPGARVLPALRQRGRVADQARLDVAGRRRNLTGALVVRRSATGALRGRRVVLVDDVLTTGATLEDAVRAVRSAGVESVTAAVVAVTLRRNPVTQA